MLLYTLNTLIIKPAARAMLIRIINDAAKKVIIKLNGSLSEYAPNSITTPKCIKKIHIKIRLSWSKNHK